MAKYPISNLSVGKRLMARGVTLLQKIALRMNGNLSYKAYMKLEEIHFDLFFGESLEENILNNTEKAHLACKRHARLVVKTLYPNADVCSARMIRAAARGSFRKNILLNIAL